MQFHLEFNGVLGFWGELVAHAEARRFRTDESGALGRLQRTLQRQAHKAEQNESRRHGQPHRGSPHGQSSRVWKTAAANVV